MANIPADLRYTKDHEYVKQTGTDAIVQIGITDYAQGELGDVVFVDLPKVGTVFARGDVFGTIERSEEHTSELQSHSDLVCRLLLEKKKKRKLDILNIVYNNRYSRHT